MNAVKIASGGVAILSHRLIADVLPGRQLQLHLFRNRRELFQCGLQIIGDFLCQDVRFWQIIGIFQAFVLQQRNACKSASFSKTDGSSRVVFPPTE